MKAYLTICLAFGLLASLGRAQESATGPGAEVPKIATASADEEAYIGLLKNELELSTQLKLLSGLAQEHRKRAEEAATANQGQKTVWETELTKELRDKCESVLKQLGEATRQRQAFEQVHKNIAATLGGLSAATADTRVTPQEIEFMKKLEERFDRANQELLAARQYASDFAIQLQTNKTVMDYQAAAATLEQNTLKIKLLEKELSDLELRKLEFQALRRP
jgi:hypothetical protein